MLIYNDIITGDELISDSYDLKTIDNVVYEADCAKITIGGETFDTGANASAEGGDEDDGGEAKETVIDIVHSFHLQETSFDKKAYLGHLKTYMKKVKTALGERGASAEEIKEFETGAAAFAKKIIANFKDYEFLIGESMDPDAMVVLLNYREDGVTPYVTLWKHGLKETKVSQQSHPIPLFPSLTLAQGRVWVPSFTALARPRPYLPFHPISTFLNLRHFYLPQCLTHHLVTDLKHIWLHLLPDHRLTSGLTFGHSAMVEHGTRQVAEFKTPVTPRKPHINAKDVNERVCYLRDELGLAIHPRETTFSPSHFKDSPSDRLYSRVQFLTFKDPFGLDKTIEEYRSELELRPTKISAQQRTRDLLERLHDLEWFAKNSFRPLCETQSPSTFPNTPSSSRPLLRHRVDSKTSLEAVSKPASPKIRKSANSNTIPGAGTSSLLPHQDVGIYNPEYPLDSGDMPESPSSRKGAHISTSTPVSTSTNPSTRRSSFTSRSRSTTANTSFATNATSVIDLTEDDDAYKAQALASQNTFGSSFGTQDVKPYERQPLFAPIESAARATKRRRSGDSIVESAILSNSEDSTDQKHEKKNQHHQITSLSGNGFGADYPYWHDEKTPFVVSVERARLAHETPLSQTETDAVTDHKIARDLLHKHDITSFQQSCPDIWTPDARQKDSKLVLSGKLAMNPKSDEKPLLQITMHPVRKEAKSTRVERHFGSDRVLTVTLPSLTQALPSHLNGNQREGLSSAVHKWLLEPKTFLGRTWCLFDIKKLDDQKVAGRKAIDPSAAYACSFFAIYGDGIQEPISHFNLMDWLLPFRENAEQPACKAWSRVGLSVKRTKPTIQFRPDQIRFGRDTLANGDPEDRTWEDPSFVEKPLQNFGDRPVMNDGCAIISVGAALELRRILGITDWPVVFQGRINGSKGLWYISAPYGTDNVDDLAIWIEIAPSQLKINPRSKDKDGSQCDADRWSFDVVKYNGIPRISQIYRDFLRILEDRGVPRRILLELISEQVVISIQEWQDASRDPARLAIQRYKHFGWTEDKPRVGEPGLPRSPAGKVQLLLDEAGFVPESCQPLAEAVERLQEMHFQNMRSQLKFPCLKSTMVFGIADPLAVLAPGEIHLSLSHPLNLESTNESFSTFAGKDVLVARNPAIRGSDIQRVKCICHPQLAYLTDIVIMPTKGQIPLAAKLQGGDYDGDTFWICADERVVEPFRNAPVLEQAGIDHFPIRQEKRVLGNLVKQDLFGTDEHVRKWLEIVVPFTCREEMLGIVTRAQNDLAYHHNDLWHPGVTMLADLHDLVIDDTKNGYSFDARDWTKFRRDHSNLFLEPSKLKIVQYRKNLEEMKFEVNPGQENRIGFRSVLLRHGQRSYSHILDDTLFNVINPRFANYLNDFHCNIVVVAEKTNHDRDLEHTLTLVQNKQPELAKVENKHLKTQLTKAYDKWLLLWVTRKPSPGAQVDLANSLQECVQFYSNIRPADASNPLWDIRHGETAPTTWDLYKVGYLAKHHYAKREKSSDPASMRNFMFWVARDAVCHLKSSSVNGKRTINRVKMVKKPKVPKNWALVDAHDDGFSMGVAHDDDDDEFGWDLDEEALDSLDQSS
ncbi:hypothetical protein Q7P37_010553 [Cladosporium fusiforme]